MGRDLVISYQTACQSYRDHWQLVDDQLYSLCVKFPRHQSSLHVNAKLMIIGRTYATGLERAIRSKPGISALGHAAEHFHANDATIDALIQQLQTLENPATQESFIEIVRIHGAFCALMRQITRDNPSTPSFASKYLHFHCPIVPIYDAYAKAAAQKMYSWRSDFDLLSDKPDIDLEYYWFVCRFNRLYLDLIAAGLDVTVKLVDFYLLYSLNPMPSAPP